MEERGTVMEERGTVWKRGECFLVEGNSDGREGNDF